MGDSDGLVQKRFIGKNTLELYAARSRNDHFRLGIFNTDGEFVRRKKLGGDDADGSTRIAGTLIDVARAVESLKPTEPTPAPAAASEGLRLAEAVLEIAVTYRKILLPLISATEERLKLDHSIRGEVERVAEKLEAVKKGVSSKKPGTP